MRSAQKPSSLYSCTLLMYSVNISNLDYFYLSELLVLKKSNDFANGLGTWRDLKTKKLIIFKNHEKEKKALLYTVRQTQLKNH